VVVGLVVLVDHLSKAIAWLFRDQIGSSIDSAALLSFGVVTNETGLNSYTRALWTSADAALLSFKGSLAVALGTLAVVLIRDRGWSRRMLFGTFLTGMLAGYFIAVVAPQLFVRWVALPLPAATTLSTTLTSFYLVGVWLMTMHTRFWLSFSLLAGGAMGNLTSKVVPPFEVVDFVYSRGVKKVFNLEIFNVADVAIRLGVIGVAVTALIVLLGDFAAKQPARKRKRLFAVRMKAKPKK
jgi:hypothetical protein